MADCTFTPAMAPLAVSQDAILEGLKLVRFLWIGENPHACPPEVTEKVEKTNKFELASQVLTKKY